MSEIITENFWSGQEFSVGSNIFFGNENFTMHKHTFFEFMLIIEGELVQVLNNEEIRLERRSLCFIYPDDVHSLKNSPKNDKVHIVNCTFSRKFLKDTENNLHLDFDKLPARWPSLVQRINPALWQAMTGKLMMLQFEGKKYSKSEQRLLFRGVLSDVLLLLASQGEKAGQQEVPAWLVKAREQMRKDENFSAGLKTFVELAGRTQEHLTRTHKKFYKETPTAYINRLRTYKAAQELLYTRKDIWDIMYECGFNNYAYFLKCFRNNFGMSPRQYIKINRRIFTL